MAKPKRTTGGSGCGYLIFTCAVSCCFLVLNCVLMRAGYTLLAPTGPEFLQNQKVVQSLLFIGPLALVFFQWWLVDKLLPGSTAK